MKTVLICLGSGRQVAKNAHLHFANRKHQNHIKDTMFVLSEPLSQEPKRISRKKEKSVISVKSR